METLWQDLRYTTRTLAKHPAFVLAGVLVLGLAIGVNTAIFSVINAILFRPLPVHAPDELRYMYAMVQRTPPVGTGLQYRHFLRLRQRGEIFSDVLLMGVLHPPLRVAGDLHSAQGEMVSSNYFDVLGLKPLIGRGFVMRCGPPGLAPRLHTARY